MESRAVRRCLLWVLVALALAAGGAVAQGVQDRVQLRNGTTMVGHVQMLDENRLQITMGNEQRVVDRAMVAVIYLGVGGEETGEFPPGFTVAAGLKLVHVITWRQLTANKRVDDGKFEPEIVRLSGDGSKIAYWGRKCGLHTMNPDGSDDRQLWAPEERDGHNDIVIDRFLLSPDGRYVYWQPNQSAPIYRINSSGGDQRLLVRSGSEYEPLRLRQNGSRIFFGSRGGLFSIDTEGRGDYREIITHKRLGDLYDWEPILLNEFDVSEDGSRVVFRAWNPKDKRLQLCAINADGTGFRKLVNTEFEPTKLTISPDGSQVFFWKYAEQAYLVNWEGTNLRPLAIPRWDGNSSGMQYLDRITSDSQWVGYEGGEAGGGWQFCHLDGSGRFDLNPGPIWYFDEALFHGLYPPSCSGDLRRFATTNQYWRQFRPRQVVYGEINPRRADGLPVVSDVDFARTLSTNPQVPAHRGTIKLRIAGGTGEIQRIQFLLMPACQWNERLKRLDADMGWRCLEGDHYLRDDGKNGDETAKDGVWTTDDFRPNTGDYKLNPGRHVLRLIVHDERNAVMVDVDGVDVIQ